MQQLDLSVATQPTPSPSTAPSPLTLTHDPPLPTQDAAIALVQQLDLGPGPGGRVAEEALAPEATCNPLLHRMQAFIASKALDAHAQVSGVPVGLGGRLRINLTCGCSRAGLASASRGSSLLLAVQ